MNARIRHERGDRISIERKQWWDLNAAEVVRLREYHESLNPGESSCASYDSYFPHDT